MSYTIVGLGNPGKEYENTRHNTGWIVLEHFRKTKKFPEWKHNKKLNAETSEGKLQKEKALLVLPGTFMNKSGKAIAHLKDKSLKIKACLIVVHDDLDLPIGTFKIAFNRGTGGHKGVDSIRRSIKTKAFIRLKVGIAPATPSGKVRKPKGEQKVSDFILGAFNPAELQKLKRILPKMTDTLEMIVAEGKEKAMNRFN
ncbi:aminoacyl-tRNA hydrolase [bacterium]|nr:aminoacyl-tRNA hydrolase [bacterium]|tara:strand:+ start:16146 stop:16739 length:594 start_codon:yes stop_codon:yes gene_type:complete